MYKIFKTFDLMFLFVASASFLLVPDRGAIAQTPVSVEVKKSQNIEDAVAQTKAMLLKYPNNDFTPNLMFQLAELYMRKARTRYQEEMARFETAEKQYDQGLIKTEPVIPKIDYREAFEVSYRLLKNYPNIHFLNKLFYRMAICHLEIGENQKAMEYFRHLVERASEKELLEEAYFRLGEDAFQKQDYATAIGFYNHLINSWDSPYFDMALYKLGWSHYNEEDYAEAISTFLYLIEDINLVEEVDTENSLGMTQADLRGEAKEYIAVCFAEFGGPAKAMAFFKERKENAYTEVILMHLAEVYQKRNYYAEAIEALNVLLDFYPEGLRTPDYHKRIIENYELAGDKERSSQYRAKFVTAYGPGSPWLQRVQSDTLRHRIVADAEQYLYSLATEAQAIGQETNSSKSYELAIGRYQIFLKTFVDSDRNAKVLFYLAECFFEIERFNEAADAYYELILQYPGSEFQETASYNRILAYHKLLRETNLADSTTLYLANFLGQGEERVDTLTVASPAQSQFLQASNDFFVYQSEAAKVPEVLMKYAENLYLLGNFDLARRVYQQVIYHPATNGSLPQAYTMLAQCEFKQGNYQDAESWFRKLIKLHPDSSRYVLKANKMIASAKFKVAENYLAEGDSISAALEFEKISATSSEGEVAEKALFEAARLQDNGGDKVKAAGLYESILSRFPDSKLIDRSLFRAGLLREELEQWSKAATNYLAVFEFDPASQFASKSLFFAAKCYEIAGDFGMARSYFDRYLRIYSEDPDRFLEAAFRKAEIAYNQENYPVALKELKVVISAYQNFIAKNSGVENYIPANAQFLIGEILFDNFKKIKLQPPLDRNLKRKKAKFQEVLKAYAASAKYKLADWTTASSYKIGVTFEEFARAFLNSPRPKSLKGEDLAKYNAKLWQSVVPFKEKALSTYERCIRQAEENSIANQWVDQSRKRMEVLRGELQVNTLGLGENSGSKQLN